MAEGETELKIICLPEKNKFPELYARYIHEIDHASIDTTVAKIRCKYWVRRCTPLVRGIKGKCVRCRIWDKKLAGQVMAPLPIMRLQPSPPFAHCAVDYFGPFTIRDTVKKRCKGKGYGVMFRDLVSRACHIEVADSYDTGGFINVLHRFHSIRGVPQTMISDNGSQLVALLRNFEK